MTDQVYRVRFEHRNLDTTVREYTSLRYAIESAVLNMGAAGIDFAVITLEPPSEDRHILAAVNEGRTLRSCYLDVLDVAQYCRGVKDVFVVGNQSKFESEVK